MALEAIRAEGIKKKHAAKLYNVSAIELRKWSNKIVSIRGTCLESVVVIFFTLGENGAPGKGDACRGSHFGWLFSAFRRKGIQSPKNHVTGIGVLQWICKLI